MGIGVFYIKKNQTINPIYYPRVRLSPPTLDFPKVMSGEEKMLKKEVLSLFRAATGSLMGAI
jgi:hypothetical protein